jgi:hypothetical protein
MGNTPMHICVCVCLYVCISRVTCTTKMSVSSNYTAVDAQSCEVEVTLVPSSLCSGNHKLCQF